MMRSSYDDTTRTVTTYDESGAVTSTRPYGPEENAAADAAATAAAAAAAADAQRATVRQIVYDLQTEKSRAQEIIDSATASAEERKLGRACKRIADAAIDLARFVAP